jgi:hypothetical protein
MPGWIIGDDGRSRTCIVSNLAPNGAKLSLVGREALPLEFTLLADGVKHRSRLVWCTGFHVGIAFMDMDTPARSRR